VPGLLNVGVDVGGTFTDLVAQPVGGGDLRVRKMLSTPDRSRALLAGLRTLLRDGEWIARLTYGTTVVTNAVLEGPGARVALVTTRGFRDVLEIGRQQRDHLYRLDLPGRVPPVVPRALRFEVTERVDHEGRVLVPLDEAEVLALADTLRRAEVEAVAVSLLHSYADPTHERRIGSLLAPVVPYVCLSSDVNPEFREYERTHTTCVHAQLMPLVDKFLAELAAGLASDGMRVPLHLMQSSGGMATPAQVRRAPLVTVMSGPAGGVAAARAVGSRAGLVDAVAFDMGGTSTDVCLIRDGQVATTSERHIAGHPVRLRSLAVESIGAGGGSIAWVDRAGALKVGPQSAGADPGPACYGRGGEEPTVTDAHVVLGYLNPEEEYGGLHLDPDRAWRVLELIAERFGLSVPEAAAAILEVANAAMIRALHLVSVQRGIDPRGLTLIAYGGAGPMHAGRLIDLAGMPRALVPPYSGSFSAYGCLAADLRHDAVRTIRFDLARSQAQTWEAPLRALEESLLYQLADEGIPTDQVILQRSMDLRYVGQNYEIEVPVEPELTAEEIRTRFTAQHRRRYEYAMDDRVEGVNVRIAAIVPSGGTGFPQAMFARPNSGKRSERWAFFYRVGRTKIPVRTLESLDGGDELLGPAIVENEWSTVIAYPGQMFRRDRAGWLWVMAAS
jgi:N-methylhydantoinase A